MHFKPRSHPLMLTLALCLCTHVWAQKNRKPPPEPAVVCTVADFRMLALSIHDPKERADKAQAWVQTYGPACTPSQLTAIISGRPALMGSADNQQLASQLDRILEVKMSNDKASIDRLYRPDAPASGNPAERVSATAGPAGGTGAAAPPPVVPEPAPISMGVGVGVGMGRLDAGKPVPKTP